MAPKPIPISPFLAATGLPVGWHSNLFRSGPMLTANGTKTEKDQIDFDIGIALTSSPRASNGDSHRSRRPSGREQGSIKEDHFATSSSAALARILLNSPGLLGFCELLAPLHVQFFRWHTVGYVSGILHLSVPVIQIPNC